MNEKHLLSDFLGSPPLLHQHTNLQYAHWPIRENTGQYTPINKQQKLGFMAEALFEQYLYQTPGCVLLAKNHQIIEDKKTRGELDFIVEHNHQAIHIELAYKFYLWHPHVGSDFNAWIGPNDKDRLDIKCKRLFEHQLPLASQVTLPTAQNTTTEIQSQYCLLGQLFSPWNISKHAVDWHKHINPAAWRGYWVTFPEFCSNKDFTGLKFFRLDKWQYFLNPQTQVAWKTYSDFLAFIKSPNYPFKTQLLWYKTPTGNLGKLFITQIP